MASSLKSVLRKKPIGLKHSLWHFALQSIANLHLSILVKASDWDAKAEKAKKSHVRKLRPALLA